MRRRALGPLLGLGLTLVLAASVAITVFGRDERVDPRLPLLAMAAVVAVLPVRRLLAALALDPTPSLRCDPAGHPRPLRRTRRRSPPGSGG